MASSAGAARADTSVLPAPGQEIAPVPRLFERIRDSFSGRILKVELELADRPAYEVKLLTDNGNVLMLSYDAMTLRLDSVVGYRDGGDDAPVIVELAGENDDADDAADARDDDDDDADAGDLGDDDGDGGRDDDRSGRGGGDDDGGNSGPGGGDDDSGSGNSGPGGGNSGPGGGNDD